MLQWLRLAVWLLLSAAVSGEEVQCDDVVDFYYCWNSITYDHDYDYCWSCTIRNQQSTGNELSIAPKYSNGIAADVVFVRFFGGNFTKMPKVINKNNDKQILRVGLKGTKTRVLNAQFFANVAQNLIYFVSSWNYNLSVVALAFQNLAVLEALNLAANGFSSIPPDAFRGLNKLFRLDLYGNNLTAINENWFDDLGNLERLDLSNNQQTEVADTAFKNLHKLKRLYLHKNKIEIVTRKMFQHNKQLVKINLHNNRIKVIESGSFAHLGKLSRFNLSGNKCINKDFENSNPEETSAALTVCLPTTCVIPLIPNGYIVNTEDNFPQTVGDSSEELVRVKAVCLPSFSLFHERANQTENECQNEVWKDEKWAECHRE